MDGVRKSQYTIAFKHFMLRKYCCFAKMNDIIKRKYHFGSYILGSLLI